ncbi:hypothetical protein KGA66_05440 [Actinocrinis puniceicyclus]|uniref:Uncharacterized protein n=1 Tax=Actinocrinis puniceicyclus TaxID=977794 RepID=A0A8J7WN50_9ACTN|nr:DUF6113 family protein [Actinocrinis puniceicyclus]MBS2962479.1 hypothetical protein [Actinocrinis puniceicyclus]
MSRPKPIRPQDAAPKRAARNGVADDAVAQPRDEVPRAAPRDERAPGSAARAKAVRLFLLLLAAVVGLVVGALGSFGHRADASWFGVAWPTGLLLAFGGLVGLLLGLSELLAPGEADSWRPTRLSAVSLASAGWLLALVLLTYLGPPPSFAVKGDVILPNDWKSITYLFGGMTLIIVSAYRAWLASLNARLARHPGAAGASGPAPGPKG